MLLNLCSSYVVVVATFVIHTLKENFEMQAFYILKSLLYKKDAKKNVDAIYYTKIEINLGDL